MFNCFKSKDRGPSKPEVKIPQTLDTLVNPIKIALIPGHTPGTSADTYNKDMTEYQFNKAVLKIVMKDYKGKHELNFFDRDPTLSYKRAMAKHAKSCAKEGVQLAIEFHVNAARVPEARGYESLIAYGDDKSAKLAFDFGDMFRIEYKHGGRGLYKGLRGVRSRKRGDRGYEFMNRMEKEGISSFIWEPFFGDYETEESAKFLNQKGIIDYANWIIRTLDTL